MQAATTKKKKKKKKQRSEHDRLMNVSRLEKFLELSCSGGGQSGSSERPRLMFHARGRNL